MIDSVPPLVKMTSVLRQPRRWAAARLASYLVDGGDSAVPGAAAIGATVGLRPGEVSDLLDRFVGAGLLVPGGGGPRVADPEELRRYLQYLDLRERFGPLEGA